MLASATPTLNARFGNFLWMLATPLAFDRSASASTIRSSDAISFSSSAPNTARISMFSNILGLQFLKRQLPLLFVDRHVVAADAGGFGKTNTLAFHRVQNDHGRLA